MQTHKVVQKKNIDSFINHWLLIECWIVNTNTNSYCLFKEFQDENNPACLGGFCPACHCQLLSLPRGIWQWLWQWNGQSWRSLASWKGQHALAPREGRHARTARTLNGWNGQGGWSWFWKRGWWQVLHIVQEEEGEEEVVKDVLQLIPTRRSKFHDWSLLPACPNVDTFSQSDLRFLVKHWKYIKDYAFKYYLLTPGYFIYMLNPSGS